VGADEEAMAVVRDRMLAEMRRAPAAGQAAEYRDRLDGDGSWDDIDYAGQTTTHWKPAEHLKRLDAMSRAWATPGAPRRGDPVLLEAIGRALDCWLRLDPRRWWWWDAIGAPGLLSRIMLMLGDELTPAQLETGTARLERAGLGGTGQNLVWQAEITARRAVLRRDPDLLRAAFEHIASEVRTTRAEGIQPDLSFHQHGPLLYNHGYGAGFAVDNARLAGLTAGTPFAYAEQKVRLVASYILDGSQWLAHGRHPDFGAVGRQITRQGEDASYLGRAAGYMLALDSGRQREFEALRARVNGDHSTPLVGNRHFYCSDVMVHHRPGWYMSARMYSTRTCNTDSLSGCDEGCLSHYLAEGATCIMRHGREYADLYPVWDWQRIPGTTVELAPHQPGEPQRQNTTPFAGGVSDGSCGAAGFALEREALTARKGWFFFSDSVCCLGSGIACASSRAVVTTVNQCRQAGPATFGNSAVGSCDGEERQETVRWVRHDGVTYVFPRPTQVRLSCRRQEGSWQRISRQRSANRVAADVFALEVPHGSGASGATYAYGVVPDAAAGEPGGARAAAPFEVLANTESLQAVRHAGDGVTGAICYGAGEWSVGEWALWVDRACAVLVRGYGDELTLCAADPAAGEGRLTVGLAWPGQEPVEHRFELPAGDSAGATVTWDTTPGV